MIDEYLNFDVKLFGYDAGADGERFSVQVERSLVGEQQKPEIVVIPRSLRDRLVALERRDLDRDMSALVAVGIEIGHLLFPRRARDFFLNSFSKLQGTQGLRIRLKCAAVELDRLPWEFAYVERGLDDAGHALGKRGFLVSDTRISMVRYELFSQLATSAKRQLGHKRLVAVLCEPDDRKDPANPLQIDEEFANLERALTGVNDVEIVRCSPPTRQQLQHLLYDGADVFHFAGHGEFQRASAGGSSSAYLILQRDDGTTDQWDVDSLASRLANKGIQLAVLGACRSAETDGMNSWAGISSSLMRAGIPAVIGMQYTIYDPSAIAFSKVLYQAWSQLGTLDEAVAEARSAILDLPENTGRDFATPVLYLRLPEGSQLGLSPESTAAAGDPATPARQVAAGPVGAARESIDLNSVLRQIAELYDYKLIHDALHTTRTRGFNLIQLRKDEFPEGTTITEFSKHQRDLKKRLQDVQRVSSQGRCDADLLRGIIEEFSSAIRTLDEALAEKGREKLEDALASFDTLLTAQPARVDTWIVSLVSKLNLDVLVDLLRSSSAVLSSGPTAPDRAAALARSAEEIHSLGTALRRKAALHSICQDIDTKLAVIKKSELNRFREIRRQWKALSDSVTRVLPEWSPDAVDNLRLYSEQLGRGVNANDEQAACGVFEAFCDDFDYGFFTVDSDLKELCGEMQSKTAQSVSSLPSGARSR